MGLSMSVINLARLLLVVRRADIKSSGSHFKTEEQALNTGSAQPVPVLRGLRSFLYKAITYPHL